MPIRIRRTHASPNDHVSNSDARSDNRIALVDESLFAAHSAADMNVVIQCVWTYDRQVDLDGLKRFRQNLGNGLLGRRIERSPLSFARHRWVTDTEVPAIDIAERALPPAQVSDWADERSQLPIDAEGGPGWHLGVLPLTDGSTAVTLVHSHYLIDGLGLALSLVDAALGNTRDLGYPPPRSRTRLRAMGQDARQAAQDVPEAARAIAAAAKLARNQARKNRDDGRSATSRRLPVAGTANNGDSGEEVVVVPAVSIHIDGDDWDARAKSLGGTANTLIAGFTAKLGERMGRRRAGDGAVVLHLPISERAEGDARANAMSIATVSVDPTRVTTDLSDARAAIKQELKTLREMPDETLKLRSLIPFTPRRALKRMVNAGFADPDLPILCSNLGDLGPWVCHVDGTGGEMVMTRATGQQVKRQWLERVGGQMTLQFWRTGGTKLYITLNAYQPGAENTKSALRELAAQTLADFDLTGSIH